jgi:glucuronoarabinoxylan endo-1,4-beta-xylanase
MIDSGIIDDQIIEGNMILNFKVSSVYPIANSDLDLDDTLQIIRDFGAANVLPCCPDMTAGEIQKAFGTGDDDIGFMILHLRLLNDQNEFYRNVSAAKTAYDMGVTIMVSPWSPPLP